LIACPSLQSNNGDRVNDVDGNVSLSWMG
jgi:hypothetical protein